MKQVFVATLLMLAACASNFNANIEGMYICDSSGEFSRAYDTLAIKVYNKEANTYTIRRNTGYARIQDGIPQEKEWRAEKMVAVFDESSGQLLDQKSGRILSFRDDEILFGTVVYKKIKQP